MIGREEKSHAGEVSKTDFEELFEAELKELQEGDIIKGRVVQVTQDAVMIDIGYKSEGQCLLRNFLTTRATQPQGR
jgi:small subunit ribosomal protein S1